MKTLIVLSSVSGVGKTSTVIPAIVNQLGATEVGTGHLFKAYMGMCFEPEIARELDYVPIADGALEWFVKSGNYAKGLQAYERAKQSGKITGFQTCNFVEGLLRSTCLDQPVKQVRMLCDIFDRDLYVTDCINLEELVYLRNSFSGYRVIVVGLDCVNPVERSGANRELVPLSYVHILLRYRLDALDKFMPELLNKLQKLINLNDLINN